MAEATRPGDRVLLAVARELAETARPITNALPGGNSAQVDPIFTDRGRFVRREP